MKNRVAILFVVLLITSSMPFPTAVAQEGQGTVDKVVDEPVDETVGTATRTSQDATDPSIVRVFHETWEDANSLEDAGWSEQVVDGSKDPQFRHVHKEKDKPDSAFVTPIETRSGSHAATIMNEQGTYEAELDTRLVSPPIDLRYVRGASASTTAVHDNGELTPFLEDLEAAYLESVAGALGATEPVTPYHYLFTTPPSGWSPIPCPEYLNHQPCARSSVEGPTDEEQVSTEGLGLANLLFFQALFGSVPDVAPSTRPDEYGADVDPSDGGSVYAPNPVNAREGLSYVNLTFWHKFDLSQSSGNDTVWVEVRERQADGSWGPWRDLKRDEVFNNPAAKPSSRFHEATTDTRTVTYNGHQGDYRPGFVGSSGGLVASTFNMNRFAGSEVQVAFHVRGLNAANAVTTPGWMVDDVVVWASTYPRDAAVQRVHAPDEMDRVATDEPFRPDATVRNFGYRPMENITVEFRVTPSDDPSVTLQRSTRFVDRLEPQESRRLTTEEPFILKESGDYDLVVNLTAYDAPTDPTDDNMTRDPETNPADQNDQKVVPFQVQDVPRATVDVEMERGSIQSNVGASKRFQVQVENIGNMPLGGEVRISLQKLDRDTLAPAGAPRVLAVDPIRSNELPYGRNLTVLGSEDNTWTKTYEWSKGVNEPGVYRIEARFVTDHGTFEGNRSTFVRATPLPYLQEDLDTPSALPFHQSSLFDHGFSASAYRGLTEANPVKPDPVSRSHVWAATGKDGGVGVARYGNATLNGTGLEGSVEGTVTYDELAVVASQHGNAMDHYWLVRDVNLTQVEDADEVVLEFWHSARFQWGGRTTADQQEPDHSRGLVEVLPQRNVPVSNPADTATNEAPNASTPETGVAPVDDRTPGLSTNATGFPIFARTVASYEDTFTWRKSTVDLTPWKGQEVTLRFHVQTTASRLKSGSFEPSDSTDVGKHGPLSPWLLDNIELRAQWENSRERVLFRDDVESSSGEGWSTNRGLTFEDEERPLAFLEGRGWTRNAYERNFPTGWHVIQNTRPQAGVQVRSPMLYWGEGDPGTTGQHPEGLNLSVLRTSSFRLGEAREPALNILHNYTFDHSTEGVGPDTELGALEGYTGNGGSVWIVGVDDQGREVVRNLLVPEEGYDATVAAQYVESGKKYCPGHPKATDASSTLDDRIYCETVLRAYEDRPNVFANRSGIDENTRGLSRWVQSSFDLSNYTRPGLRDLRYHVEFHAIHQSARSPNEWGWLIDDIRITEGTFANDMALEGLVQPTGGKAVGPGLQVPVALNVQNRGLYDQAAVEVRYRVLDADGNVVFGPVVEHTNAGRVIPGEGNEQNPNRNITHIFSRTWRTPDQEGTYILETSVNLSGSLPGQAYPDDNPFNDVLRTPIRVEATRSVGLLSSERFSDRSAITPFLGSTEELRTLTAKVRNEGTLPEVFTAANGKAGQFTVNLTVKGGHGDVVFQTSAPIRKLAPGETKAVTFRNAWHPSTSGTYRVIFDLNHPNETATNAGEDNRRVIIYRVFDKFVPKTGETIEGIFKPEAGGWSWTDKGWRFGDGDSYPPRTEAILNLQEPLNLLALRSALLTVNHTYSFEEGYDGAVLEVSVDEGESWIPVPPVKNETATGDERVGYPVNASVGSPLRTDLFHENKMLSGTSGEGDAPQPVTDIFDLGAVTELVNEGVTIFDDNLTKAGPNGSRAEDARLGTWSTRPLSIVEPHSGERMWHSNRTVADLCWLFKSENASERFDDGCNIGENRVETAKYLNLTFTEEAGMPELGDALTDPSVSGLRISFWDYRAIGSVNPDDPPETPNEVEVYLICVSCSNGQVIPLNRLDNTGYDNDYRGWTRNVYTISQAELLDFQGEDLRLSFVHHTTVDPEGSGNLRATGRVSPHLGWFLDDVEVSLVEGSGGARTFWSDDIESRSRTMMGPHADDITKASAGNETWWAEKQDTGPWTGTWTGLKGQSGQPAWERLLWDVRSSYGEPLWQFWNQSETAKGALPGWWNTDEEDPMWVARGPNSMHYERVGGDRLMTPVNLRSAVGNVTLSFDHAYQFDDDPSSGKGYSGGTVEVSVDGGKTWIPLEPKPGYDGNFEPLYNVSDDPVSSTHNTIAGAEGDPEGDSIYGVKGKAFTGETTGSEDPWRSAEYDLSRFAGRKVLVSWHAFFGSFYDAKPSSHQEWFWAVDDVKVQSNVLDGQHARLRLRAGTDATESRQGWTVHDLQLTGIKHDVNSAVRVQGIDPNEPVPAEEKLPFRVRVENRGQLDDPVKLDLTVTVEGDSNTWEWRETGIEVAPESTRVLTSVGGQELAFEPLASSDYTVKATVTIVDQETRNREAIKRDNTGTVTLPKEMVLDSSHLEPRRVTVNPNHVRPGSEPVRVETTVANSGFAPRDLQGLNLTVTPKDGGEPVLRLTRSDLVKDPGEVFDDGFERKTYAWRIPSDTLQGIGAGLYDVEVHVDQLQDGPKRTSEAVPLYLGDDYVSDYAIVEHVQNDTKIDGSPGNWETASAQGGPPYQYSWGLSGRNRSLYKSFGVVDVTPGARQGSGGNSPEGGGGNNVAGRTWITSPALPVDKLGDRVAVTFYTQYSVSGYGNLTVLYDYSKDRSSCDPTPSSGPPPTDVAGYIHRYDDPRDERTSDGLNEGRWEHHSAAIPPSEDPNQRYVCVAFYGWVNPTGGSNSISQWRVDDVIFAPYNLALGPDIEAPVRDDTLKTFRFRIENQGAFNDTYRFEFLDASGVPVDIPPSWKLRVLTPQGEEVDRVSLAAGEIRELLLEVRVPVQQASGTTGVADLALTAVSMTNPLVRKTMDVDLSFEYPPRPNLAVFDVRVNDKDLPAGQPRSIVATVANRGDAPARNVPMSIRDTMPPRFGVAPVELTRIDGEPLGNLTLDPGEIQTVLAQWTPRTSGPHNVTVHLDPGNQVVESAEEDNTRTVRVVLDAARFPDLRTQVRVSDTEPQVGDQVHLNATITNQGSARATGVQVSFRVGVTDLLDGTPPHILPDPIDPGETVHLTATWPAPFPGEYRVFARAFPLSGALERVETEGDNLAIQKVEVRSKGLDLDGPDAQLTADPGSVATAPVQLANRGDALEVVDVTVDAPQGIRAHLERDGVTVSRLALENGTTTNLTLQARTPARIATGTYPVKVTVRSLNTTQVETVAVPLHVRETHGLSVEGRSLNVDPGHRSVPVHVRNLGNGPVSVEISSPDLPSSWSLRANAVNLDPYEDRRVNVTLRIPTRTAAGVVDLTVEASTEDAHATGPLRVNVQEREVVNLTTDPGELHLRPGGEATVNVTLRNVGNAPAFADLGVEAPNGWTVDLPRPRARLAPGDSLALTLPVTVPEDAGSGTYPVTLTATSGDETFRGNVTVHVGIPDLTVAHIQQSPRVNIEQGETVTFNVSLRNAGNLASDDVPVGLYVSDDLVGYETLTSLGAGAGGNVEFTWPAEAGEHVVLVVVDPGEDIVESDEGNNAHLLVVGASGDVSVFTGAQRAVPLPVGWVLVSLVAAALCFRRRWTS